MFRFLKAFLKVTRSYSIEEKVVSLVILILVLVLSIQSFRELFRSPASLNEESTGLYTEGLVNPDPVSINPMFVDFSDANRDISSLVFSGLTRYDAEVGAFVEDLAELTISEDRMHYDFKIKDNVLWHDGEILTVDDVYFTYHDVIQDKDFQNPVLKANFDGVEIVKKDESSVEFVLSKPNSFFITNLNVGILPEHLLGGIPVIDLPYSNFNRNPVGSGPYKVASALELNEESGKQKVLLEVFNDYYGKKPSIKQIRFQIFPDSESLLSAQGTLNVISKVPFEISKQIESSGRFNLFQYELPQYTAVFMNMDSPILKSSKVRIAIQKGIEKEKIPEISANKTLVDTPLMSLEQTEWLNKPNIEEAQGALFDSGYKMSNDENDPYRKNSKGENLKLRLLVRQLGVGTAKQEDIDTVLNFLVESWKNIGIEIELDLVTPDVFAEKIHNREYDLLFTGESLGYNLDTYAYWHSSQADGRGLNLSNFKSFAADSLIEKLRDTFDPTTKESLLQSLGTIISTDVPAVFLYRPSYIYANDGKVENVKLNNLAYPSDRFADVSNWCMGCSE